MVKRNRAAVPSRIAVQPMLTMANRQRAVRLDLQWLRLFAESVLPASLAVSRNRAFALGRLAEVSVAIVSDRAMARLHAQFMGIDEPTDVLTFLEGDVAISADTARARAGEFGHGVEEELGLYIVHALLHLNGFDDTTPRAAARMRKVQDRIWREGCAALPPPDP